MIRLQLPRQQLEIQIREFLNVPFPFGSFFTGVVIGHILALRVLFKNTLSASDRSAVLLMYDWTAFILCCNRLFIAAPVDLRLLGGGDTRLVRLTDTRFSFVNNRTRKTSPPLLFSF